MQALSQFRLPQTQRTAILRGDPSLKRSFRRVRAQRRARRAHRRAMTHPRCAFEITVLILAALPLPAQQAVTGRSGPPPQSPAAKRPPATKSAQSYSAADIQAGEARFISQCGFCHGRDAQGGESGPDLTRSLLVAGDVRGDKIDPLILSGRPAAGMPAFSLPRRISLRLSLSSMIPRPKRNPRAAIAVAWT